MEGGMRSVTLGLLGAMLGLAILGGCGAPQTTYARRDNPQPQSTAEQGAQATREVAPQASGEAAATPATSSEASSRASPSPQPSSGATDVVVLSPAVRVDRGAGFVELDGTVAIDVHGATPKVYLEVLVCTPNTREHESLVLTRAKAQDVHAGLLLLGLEAGTPASFAWQTPVEGEPRLVGTAASGARVRVLVQPEGSETWVPLVRWMCSERDDAGPAGSGFAGSDSRVREDFVFAGSTFRRVGPPQGGREMYAADIEGTLVGLTAFGTETVAYAPLHNPDAQSEQPHFVADASVLPTQGTRVRVRVEAVRESRVD
jgi:hypothetical protein